MRGSSERWKERVKCNLSKIYTISLLTPIFDKNFITEDSQLYILKLCTIEGTPDRRLSSFKGFFSFFKCMTWHLQAGLLLFFYFTPDLIITILCNMWRWNLHTALQGRGGGRTICQSILSSICFLISCFRTCPKGSTGPPVSAEARHAFPDCIPKHTSGHIHDENRSLLLFRR